MKLLNKWDTSNIAILDPGVRNYIGLTPILVPRTGGRYAKFRFYRVNMNIVERLMNRLMVAGHRGKKHRFSSGKNVGKVNTVFNIVVDALNIVEQKTQKNPVEVLVKAVENAAPREEITAIEYGGARYPKAVDCSPQRRVDISLKNMAQGTYSKTVRNKKSASQCLADEIINAYNLNMQSNAIAKKFELERQSDSSR